MTRQPDTAAAASVTGRLWEARSPAVRHTAVGTNPRLYGKYSVDHEWRLTSHLQSRDAPLLFHNHASNSGVGRHEYRPPVTNERSMSFPHLSYPNDPGLVSGECFSQRRGVSYKFSIPTPRWAVLPVSRQIPSHQEGLAGMVGAAAIVSTRRRIPFTGNSNWPTPQLPLG